MRRFYSAAVIIGLVFAFGLVSTAGAADIPEELQKLKPADFPRKPIELVVVYPAGGGMDVTARILAKHLPKYVGTKCIVVNKTGGGGMVGHAYITTTAPADGYVVGVMAGSLVTDDLTRAKGQWSYQDLKWLALINFTPLTWVTTSDSPVAKMSLKELVDHAKKNPNQIKIAVIKGMDFEYMTKKVEMTTGAKFNMVGFQGGAPCVTAALGGHVDVASAYLGEYKGHLEGGKIKVLGQAGPGPYKYLPGVPSFNEALGVKDIIFGANRFATVPKNTPADRCKFLEAAIIMALKDPELQKDYDNIGIDVDSRFMNAEQTKKDIDEYYVMKKELFKDLGITK